MKYPDVPGFQNTDTSKQGAPSKEEADTVREKVYSIYRNHSPYGLTADEAGWYLGIGPFTIRPRVTELKRQGRLTDSGVRRRNGSGKKAIVLIIPAAV